MEDFIDLIIVVAIFGISIASSISKAKKQKAQRSKQNTEVGDEDPWASIKKYFEEDAEEHAASNEELEDVYAQQESDTYKMSKVAPVAAEAEQVAVASPYQAYSGPVHEMGVSEKKEATSKYKSKKLQQVVTDMQDEEKAPIEDFDLRAAIIYSEILKPKFED